MTGEDAPVRRRASSPRPTRAKKGPAAPPPSTRGVDMTPIVTVSAKSVHVWVRGNPERDSTIEALAKAWNVPVQDVRGAMMDIGWEHLVEVRAILNTRLNATSPATGEETT